jgi:hypothetical protein
MKTDPVQNIEEITQETMIIITVAVNTIILTTLAIAPLPTPIIILLGLIQGPPVGPPPHIINKWKLREE